MRRLFNLRILLQAKSNKLISAPSPIFVFMMEKSLKLVVYIKSITSMHLLRNYNLGSAYYRYKDFKLILIV
jgi:hypothetical protein